MSKNPILLAPDASSDRGKSKLLLIVSISVLALLVAPLFMEGVALCYAQWCDVLGNSVAVRTPILDSIGDQLRTVQVDIRNALTPVFERVPWNPKVVLPIAVVIMALAMALLRR